jgi:hypothetical protein
VLEVKLEHKGTVKFIQTVFKFHQVDFQCLNDMKILGHAMEEKASASMADRNCRAVPAPAY